MEYKLTFKEYNSALKSNRLLGLKCRSCGKITCPPKITCQECGSLELDIVELRGRGKIITFTSSYIVAEGRQVESPYVMVMVGLDEGPWILGNLSDVDPSNATMSLIGDRVKLGPYSKIFPGDMYCVGGKEVEGGIARPTFIKEQE